MSVRNIMTTAAVLILMCAAGACVIAVVDYPGGREFPASTTTEVYEFFEGGEITIENMDGDITVEGWDRNEVELILEKYFDPQGGTRFGVYGRKDLVPEVDVEELDGALRIRTRSREKEMGYVNMTLRVPRSVNLRRIILREGSIDVSGLYGAAVLEAIEGDITVRNYSGSLTVFVESGSIDAELLDLRDSDEVSLTASSGLVTIRLDDDVNASVEASVSGGEIVSDFDFGGQDPADRIVFQIGEEGAGIRLSSLDGSVYIRRRHEEIRPLER